MYFLQKIAAATTKFAKIRVQPPALVSLVVADLMKNFDPHLKVKRPDAQRGTFEVPIEVAISVMRWLKPRMKAEPGSSVTLL